MVATVDGKFLAVDGRRFPVRGVTYGTFAPTELGPLPGHDQLKRDFAAMAEAGVNVVRTYTAADDAVLDLADDLGLKVLLGIWWGDPRLLQPPTRAAWSQMAAGARAAVRETARRAGDHPAVLGLVVANELPAHVVRWHGRRRVEALLRGLYGAAKEAAPRALVAYANYPTTEYLDTSAFDFDCVNVFLEHEVAFRRYLAALQLRAGDRPLLLTELGLDAAAHGERRQAEVLEWQLRAAAEQGVAGTFVFSWTDDWWVAGRRVEDWRFGVTTVDRAPKPALDVMAGRYHAGLRGLRRRWPGVSVVVCAYQEEATIGRCLESLQQLDYPDYEVIVVDDGSTDATAAIAARHPVRLFSQGRGGLCAARNLGLAQATGEIVAYLDADAWADRDWLTYLVLALDRPGTAGAGGPNRCPPDDSPLAQCIGRAPGNPAHVLIDHERAEHVPGCNMAFHRDRLLEVGGFDPVYRTAGDDVDLCWRLLDAGHDLRFAPAALVWHHPRARVLRFWRQQVGYGRAEALVARNHPERFNALGQAQWRGTVYGPAAQLPGRARVYAGVLGEAPYQRLYRGDGLRLAPALYAVAAVMAVAPLVPGATVAAAIGAVALVAACCWHGVRCARQERLARPWWSGTVIGLLHLLQPLARAVGRLRGWHLSFPPPETVTVCFPALRRGGRGVLVAPGVAPQERASFLRELRDRLRAGRLRATITPAWSEADVVCRSALLWQVHLTAYVECDTFFLRVRRGLCRPRAGVALVVLGAVATAWPLGLGAPAVALLAVVGVLDGWRCSRRVARALLHPRGGPAR